MAEATVQSSQLAGTHTSVMLANDRIRVTLLPGLGGDIYSVVDVRTGIDVLWKTPWGLPPHGPTNAGDSIAAWVNRYAGGWQVLLPSGGGPSKHGGIIHPYHGEACMRGWSWRETRTADGDVCVALEVRLIDTPFLIERKVRLSADGASVIVDERITNEGSAPSDYMWCHHPSFGAPLIEPGVRITTSATSLVADAEIDGDWNPLELGSRHRWPVAAGRDGADLDLSIVPPPEQRRSLVGYLSGFTSGAATILNPRIGLACTLSWPLEVYPYAWLWQEFRGEAGWPWYGRVYAVAIEPCTSYPGVGLGGVVATTKTHRTLPPGESAQVEVRMTLTSI